jgi:pyruvate dehydrogenase E2 component (dihydrolipoamide acetyltransferase)
MTVVDGVRTRRLASAPLAGAPPVVLLHGWGDSAGVFRPVLERLPGAEAYDLPGYGEAHAASERETLEELDAFVAALLRRFDGPVVLAGYSLGGLLALRAAAAGHPKVGAVVAIAPPGLVRPRLYDVVERLAPVPRFLRRLPIPDAVTRTTARVGYRAAIAADAQVPSEAVDAYLEHWGDRESFFRQWASMFALVRELRDAIDVDAIDVPVTYLWGRDDRVVPADHAADLPPEDVVLLDGVGHVPPLEAPDQVAEALSRARSAASSTKKSKSSSPSRTTTGIRSR